MKKKISGISEEVVRIDDSRVLIPYEIEILYVANVSKLAPMKITEEMIRRMIGL